MNPSSRPSLQPSMSPSLKPSGQSTLVPSTLPSAVTSSPSMVPSGVPSMSPTCSVAEMLWKVYYTPATTGILNVCFKVELFANGIFSVDLSNPNCANSLFQDSSVLSVFHSINGNVAFYNEELPGAEYTGKFTLEEDMSSVDIRIGILQFDYENKQFEAVLYFPSCEAPSLSPSDLPSTNPSLVPTILPSLKPSSRPSIRPSVWPSLNSSSNPSA